MQTLLRHFLVCALFDVNAILLEAVHVCFVILLEILAVPRDVESFPYTFIADFSNSNLPNSESVFAQEVLVLCIKYRVLPLRDGDVTDEQISTFQRAVNDPGLRLNELIVLFDLLLFSRF